MSQGKTDERKAPLGVIRYIEEPEEKEDNIDLVELVFRVLSKWKFIVCMVLVFALMLSVYAFYFVAPKYSATSTIYILNRKDSAINIADLQIGTALAQDYMKVFQIWEVHAQVIENLALPYTYSEMQEMVEVANDNGTRMLDITVTSPSPREAAEVANEYARVVSSYIAEIMATEEPSIVSVALEPTNPSNLGIAATAVIGAVLGLILALVIVCIQYFRDDMYKTADDIRKYTGLANLAVVPMSDTLTRKKNHRAKVADK